MKILSIDSTARTASVCLSEIIDGELYPVSQINLNSTLTHSETLLPMIDFCLECAKCKIADVDINVISNGPGSFTGVRIGVSTLMGLALSRDLIEEKVHACVQVSSLLSLALNVSSAKNGNIVCPLMDARRSQFYNAIFLKTKNGFKRLCNDRIITNSELVQEIDQKYSKKQIIVVGDGAEIFLKKTEIYNEKIKKCENSELFQNAFSVAKAMFYTDSAENILKEAGKYSCKKLSPLYLRASQAERELNNKNKDN